MSSRQSLILLGVIAFVVFAIGIYNLQSPLEKTDTAQTTSKRQGETVSAKPDQNSSDTPSDGENIFDDSVTEADSGQDKNGQKEYESSDDETSEQTRTDSVQNSEESNAEETSSSATSSDFPQKGVGSEEKKKTSEQPVSTEKTTDSMEEESETQEESDSETQEQEFEGQPPFQAGPDQRWYRVKEGDTLWSISEKEYGSGKHFSDILELNKGRIKDYNQISQGDWLLLPDDP